MKNLLVIIALFIVVSNSSAQDLETIMKQGNEFYQSKQYNEAITSYESILKQGYISGDLFYNLGNAYFKIGHLGKSILYYEKALKISPSNEDAAYNLKIANSRTVDKIQDIPTLFFIQWWNILLSLFTSATWQIIIIIFYLLFLVCIGVYFLIRNLQLQKFALIFGFINIFLLFLSIILFISSINREMNFNNGILIQSVISTKISPDIQSSDAFVIHEGIKFEIEDKVDNWSKIKLSDGKVGWLPNQSFEEI
ncbi:MAG: tetratricopeptide repeat protein [Ignavibacteriae bacterium]|nr:tetratricopeptide repeat protein [Ignavibacteriota bacterium]